MTTAAAIDSDVSDIVASVWNRASPPHLRNPYPVATARPHGRASKRVYLCRPAVHVARSLGALDGFIGTLALEYLVANDIGAGLRESERQLDVGPLRTNRAALAARVEELFAAGAVDAS